MPPATGAAQAIFGEALELPPASRTAFLDAACRGDAALRAELDDLLAVYERMGRFLDPSGPRDEGTAVNGPSTGHSPAGEFPPFHPTLTRTPSGAGAPGPPSRTPTALGGYRIERPLGEGGMGAVYLACDDKLGRAVALKTMRPEVAARPGAVERFLREAQATARVAHDNVVPILHVGEDAGVPYIVMPLLEGEPLDRLLKRAPAPPLGVVLKVGREIADGLAAAHARGLVHRDIKPANVWLEGNPQAADPRNRFKRVKVLDFGLVRPAHDDTQLTGPGAVLGTPAYMAPEQARGEPVDARTDLFSLGVVLYRMTTGRAPFAGSTAMAVLTALAVHHPPAPAEHHSGVPKPLSDLIMRLLAKDRDGRPASAAEVAAAVRRIGRQLAAARKARALPVVVPVPAGPPAGTHFDPWTEIDTGPPAGAAAPLTRPAPAPAPRVQSANRRAVGVRMRVAAGLVAFLALGLAAVVVIRFDTPEGTLVVEVSDPEVEARFKGGKLILAGPDGRERYTLTAAEPGRKIAAGKYLLRVEGADGLALDTSEFTLRRRDEVTVRVTLRPPPSPSTDHPAAAWVFSMGGTVRVRDADRDIRAATDLPKGAVQLTRADLRASARVTDAGLAALANCAQLRHLDLNGTGTSDAGLLRLKKLAHLSTLRLGKTRVTDAGLEHLGALTRLTELCLSDDPAVGGSGLKHLGGLKGLTFLNLNGSGVTDPGLAGLAGLTKLTRLYLRGTGLTAPALAHLKDMTELRWLELIDQPVGDAGLERLAGLAALEHLDVRGKTNVTAAGVEAFAGARAGCRVVWNGGVVGPPAADRDAAAWVLSVGGHVTVEGAAGGGREVGAADGLPAGPLTVTGVSFQHVPEIRDADLARLKGLPALAAVSLHGKGVTDAGLEHLRGARALMSLTLTSTKVTDGGLKCLTGLGALRRLDLNSTGITDAGLEHLNRLPALAELELGMTGVTDAGLGALKDLKLTALYLGRTAVTDAGLKHLEGQAGLATLELARTRVTGAGVRRLAKIRALQWLNLSGIPLADGDLSALKELKLQTLFLSGTPVTDAGLEHLAAQHALSRLWADDTAVTDGAADKLKKALPRCEILR